MPEVVATIPSKPLGTCAAVTLDILPRSSYGMRCGRTKGRDACTSQLTFIRQNCELSNLRFQSKVLDRASGNGLAGAGAISDQHPALSCRCIGQRRPSRNWPIAEC